MILDYFFYLIYRHFLKQKYRKFPRSIAVSQMFLVYLMNIVALFGFINRFCSTFHYSIAVTVITSVLLYVLLPYYYNDERAQVVVKGFEDVSRNRRIILNGTIVIYLITSVILFFMFVPYFA